MALDFISSFKKWWATEPWKKINPFAPGMSFGKAAEKFEEIKESTIKQTTSFIKSISLPLFLIVVIGIIALIFWKRIQRILVKVI